MDVLRGIDFARLLDRPIGRESLLYEGLHALLPRGFTLDGLEHHAMGSATRLFGDSGNASAESLRELEGRRRRHWPGST